MSYYDELIARYVQDWDPRDPNSYNVPSVIIGGAVGSGKSSLQLARYFLSALYGGMTYQFLADPSRTNGIAASAHTILEGHLESHLLDDLNDPSRGIGILLVGISELLGLDGEAENAEFANHFVESLKTMFGDDQEVLISVEEWATFAAQFIQYQSDAVLQIDIFAALKPWTKRWAELRSGCTNPAVKDKADHLRMMFDRGYAEFVKGVGATLRRLDVLERDPVIRSRLWDGSRIVREVMAECGAFVFLGAQGKTSARSQDFLVRQWHKWHIREVARHWSTYLEPLRCQMLSDESFRRRYCGVVEIGSVSEQRKEGINWVFCGPSPVLLDPTMNEELWQATNEHIFLRAGSFKSAELFAYDRLNVNPYKVKRVRERIRSKIVDYRTVTVKSTARSVDHEGNVRVTESENIHFEPVSQDVTDREDEYQTVPEQITVEIMKQMELPNFSFYQKTNGTISGPHVQPRPADPYDGDELLVVEEHLDWLRERGTLKGVNYSPSTPASPSTGPEQKKHKKSAADVARQLGQKKKSTNGSKN